MKTNISAKNMVISQGISDRILRKTSKMERYLNPNTEIFVHLNKAPNGQRTCEITVPIDGATLRAEAASGENLYVCIDQALGRLERQIHKHRTRLEKRLRDTAFAPAELEYDVEDAETVESSAEPKIVRRKTFPVRPMHLEDAVLQMDLLGHDFFVFVNVDTERTNVIYRRKDGNLGLLEPEA